MESVHSINPGSITAAKKVYERMFSARDKRHAHEFAVQQEYYKNTADSYDAMHVSGKDEHDLALSMLIGYARFVNASSVLDVGTGTGRVLRRLKQDLPDVTCIGIEPSDALRKTGMIRFKLSEDDIIQGNALSIQFPDNHFDIVCAFGVLHHIRTPERAVNEMLRVASKAVVISDSNNFGQGRYLSRIIKQTLNTLGLWGLANLIKTRGKGYILSKGDGLAYSYSVFKNWDIIRKRCNNVYLMNTRGISFNHYRTADHVVLIGEKK